MNTGIHIGNNSEDGKEFTKNFVEVLRTLKEIRLAQKYVVPVLQEFTKRWQVSNATVQNCIVNGNDPEATL